MPVPTPGRVAHRADRTAASPAGWLEATHLGEAQGWLPIPQQLQLGLGGVPPRGFIFFADRGKGDPFGGGLLG